MFCDYQTGYAGMCGMPIKGGKRCKRHIGLKQQRRKVRIIDYSGDSKYRQEMGQFQAKEGR